VKLDFVRIGKHVIAYWRSPKAVCLVFRFWWRRACQPERRRSTWLLLA